MSDKITKVYINRKMEDNQTAILILDTSNTDGNNCYVDKIFLPADSPISTREYMTYLVARDLKELEKEIEQGLNLDRVYNFIIPDMLSGINFDSTRLHYITTKTTKEGKPLGDNFVAYVNSIHFSLQRLNKRVRLMTKNYAVPHEYNGKILGSKYNAELLDKAWSLMDTIAPKKELNFMFRE